MNLLDLKLCRQKQNRLACSTASSIYILDQPAQLDEKALIASFAYDAPAFSISVNAGRVFWDITFRPNKVWGSVNICQNVFVAPKNISILISHEALYWN